MDIGICFNDCNDNELLIINLATVKAEKILSCLYKCVAVICHFMTIPATVDIYIDEAGYTGQDLLNKEQVVFILSSNNFSVTELSELSAMFENNTELHFKKLKESEGGRQSIIKFLNHSLITEKNIVVSTIHKEFATVAQIVDQIIEPVYYDNDIDIYQYGQNVSITNFIIHFGTFFWDKGLYNAVLYSFIEMMRVKSKESISNFYSAAKKLYNSNKTKERKLLAPILASEAQIDFILENVNKFTIDVTLSAFYILCDLWYKKTGKKLNIYHDDSKQIEHQKQFIEFTKSLNIPQQEIGYGSRKMTFPTQIEKIELVNSKHYLGVQISDLIASSLGFMYSNKNEKQNRFVTEIQNSRLVQLTNYHTVWPSGEITPEDLRMEKGNGQNVLDFLADQMIKSGI